MLAVIETGVEQGDGHPGSPKPQVVECCHTGDGHLIERRPVILLRGQRFRHRHHALRSAGNVGTPALLYRPQLADEGHVAQPLNALRIGQNGDGVEPARTGADLEAFPLERSHIQRLNGQIQMHVAVSPADLAPLQTPPLGIRLIAEKCPHGYGAEDVYQLNQKRLLVGAVLHPTPS